MENVKEINSEIIIAVDLDGTLTPTDTLHESVLFLLRESPISIFQLAVWLFGGKAAFKAKVSERIELDVTMLPYNKDLIQWLKEERRTGKLIVLCTAADKRVAKAIADYLGLFDEVLASDGITNNSGVNKRQLLDSRYGVKGYDYAGNSVEDIKVWMGSRRAIVVNGTDALTKRAAQVTTVSKVFQRKSWKFSHYSSMLRVHQWMKNLLLFVPLLAAHQIDNFESFSKLTLAFLSFSLCASAVYITNDLLDLESDRKHPRKRHRSFASVDLPIKLGAVLAPIFIMASFIAGLFVGKVFTAWLFAYFIVTCGYSLWLKRLALIDCQTLAVLYTLRIIAGAAVIDITPSFWLLAFSIFIFLSLAFVKRYAELQVQASVGNTCAHGRGYAVSDAQFVQTLGTSAGYSAVLVLALYIQSNTVKELYTTPELIWFTLPVVLFWISWVWMKAHRLEMHDDPIIFALKDKSSHISGLLFFLILYFAV
jgi:4-hydroxybenzoate polyprenyltransferase